jgi:hypothetical protein
LLLSDSTVVVADYDHMVRKSNQEGARVNLMT